MKSDITNILSSQFDEQVTVSKVTGTVYEIESEGRSPYRYAKIWPENKKPLLNELTSIEGDVGLPRSRLVNDERPILIMQPVEGKQLSRALARDLLPGLWSLRSGCLIEALNRMGQKVGRLHAETTTGSAQLDPSSLSFDRCHAVRDGQLADPLEEILDEWVVRKINQILIELSKVEVPVSIVHGDLMLFHIYLSGVDITFIDFDNMKRVPAIDDRVLFICALEILIRRLPYARWNQFNRLRIAFETGYEQTGPSYNLDTKMWNQLRAIRHCHMLMYYHEKLLENPNEELTATSKAKLRVLSRIDTPLLKRAIRNLVV